MSMWDDVSKYGIDISDEFREQLNSNEYSTELASASSRASIGLNPEIAGGTIGEPLTEAQVEGFSKLRDGGYDVPDAVFSLASVDMMTTDEAALVMEGVREAGKGGEYAGPADRCEFDGRPVRNVNGHAQSIVIDESAALDVPDDGFGTEDGYAADGNQLRLSL